MPKTLNNIGTATMSTFEDEAAPMYHVRSMAGSAKDAVIAAMKIPNENFIIPSTYDIVKRTNKDMSNAPVVGANVEGTQIDDNIKSTFNKVL